MRLSLFFQLFSLLAISLARDDSLCMISFPGTALYSNIFLQLPPLFPTVHLRKQSSFDNSTSAISQPTILWYSMSPPPLWHVHSPSFQSRMLILSRTGTPSQCLGDGPTQRLWHEASQHLCRLLSCPRQRVVPSATIQLLRSVMTYSSRGYTDYIFM